MAAIIKPIKSYSRRVGHADYKSMMTIDKGKFLASTKLNGKEFIGSGPSERLAQLDLRKLMREATDDPDQD